MNNVNLDLYQGDDFAALITVLNIADGSPANLTGYTAQAQIRTGPADQTYLATVEITATVALPNFISLYLANSQTLLLQGLAYFWDLQITSSTGLITTIMAGDVNVTTEITREGVSAAWATSPQPWLQGYPYQVRPGPQALLVQ